MMEGGKEEGEREGGGRPGRRGEKGSIGLVGWRFIYNAERPGGSGGCVCVLGGVHLCVPPLAWLCCYKLLRRQPAGVSLNCSSHARVRIE